MSNIYFTENSPLRRVEPRGSMNNTSSSSSFVEEDEEDKEDKIEMEKKIKERKQNIAKINAYYAKRDEDEKLEMIQNKFSTKIYKFFRWN
jgi:hypothetical protein